jgi:hypothetical protein
MRRAHGGTWGGVAEREGVSTVLRERERKSHGEDPGMPNNVLVPPVQAKKKRRLFFLFFSREKKEEYTHTRHIKQHHTRTHDTKSKTIHKQSRALVGMKGWT